MFAQRLIFLALFFVIFDIVNNDLCKKNKIFQKKGIERLKITCIE